MTETYTSSKGETILIKDMANPHMIHSIAKLAGTIATRESVNPEEDQTESINTLKALKNEAIARLSAGSVNETA